MAKQLRKVPVLYYVACHNTNRTLNKLVTYGCAMVVWSTLRLASL